MHLANSIQLRNRASIVIACLLLLIPAVLLGASAEWQRRFAEQRTQNTLMAGEASLESGDSLKAFLLWRGYLQQFNRDTLIGDPGYTLAKRYFEVFHQAYPNCWNLSLQGNSFPTDSLLPVALERIASIAWVAERWQSLYQIYMTVIDAIADPADPSRPDAFYDLGQVALNAGATKSALANFQQALLLRPQDVEIQARLGDAYQTDGQFFPAAAAFQLALTSPPSASWPSTQRREYSQRLFTSLWDQFWNSPRMPWDSLQILSREIMVLPSTDLCWGICDLRPDAPVDSALAIWLRLMPDCYRLSLSNSVLSLHAPDTVYSTPWDTAFGSDPVAMLVVKHVKKIEATNNHLLVISPRDALSPAALSALITILGGYRRQIQVRAFLYGDGEEPLGPETGLRGRITATTVRDSIASWLMDEVGLTPERLGKTPPRPTLELKHYGGPDTDGVVATSWNLSQHLRIPSNITRISLVGFPDSNIVLASWAGPQLREIISSPLFGGSTEVLFTTTWDPDPNQVTLLTAPELYRRAFSCHVAYSTLDGLSDAIASLPVDLRQKAPLKTMPDLCPSDFPSQLIISQAEDYLRVGDIENADSLYRIIQTKCPAYPGILSRLIQLSSVRGDTISALEWLHQALAADPRNPDLLFAYGQYLLGMGYTSDALNAFRGVVRLDPTYARAWLKIGLILDHAEDYPLAGVDAYRKVIDLHGDVERIAALRLQFIADSLAKETEKVKRGK